MKRVALTFAVLALWPAVGRAAQPASNRVADAGNSGNASAVPAVRSEQAAQRTIRDVLKEPTRIDFVDTPFKDIVRALKDLHHVDIQLDLPALKEAGV